MRREKIMTFWSLLGIILVAGAVGGILNSLISERGFQLPGVVRKNGTSILVLGFVGDIIIGAIAAGISWAFFQPLSQVALGTIATTGAILATIFGGVFTGLAGAGWLNNPAVRVATLLGLGQAPLSVKLVEGTGTASPPEAEKIEKKVNGDREETKSAENG
jgi:hypothetical protein